MLTPRNPIPFSTPSVHWLENEKKEFERIMRPVMLDADFTRTEEGNYTGRVLHVYLGWIARARRALDDAISAFKE